MLFAVAQCVGWAELAKPNKKWWVLVYCVGFHDVQPNLRAKVSALSCGRLDGFSIERLISFLNKLDRDVEIVVKKKPARRKNHGRLRVAFL